MSIIQDVIPITITSALHLTSKGNVLGRKERTLKQKYAYLEKWNGAINVVILHIANLLLIYVPLKLVLPLVLPNVEKDWEMRFVYAILVYVLTLIPFLGLEYAFIKFGRRWRLLESEAKHPPEVDEIPMIKQKNENDTRKDQQETPFQA